MTDEFRYAAASVTEFRAHLAEYLRLLELRRARLVLRRHGAPAGALVTFSDFEALRRRAEGALLDELILGSPQQRPQTYLDFLHIHGLNEEE